MSARPPERAGRAEAPRNALLRIALAFVLGACGPKEPERPPPPPAGAVLLVDGEALPAEEVDQVAGWILPIEPRAGADHLRRLALTNVVLPRLAARSLAPEARGEALATALRRAAELAAGAPARPAPAQEPREQTGHWRELGIVPFGVALESGPGRWSEVVESPGAFHLVRLLATDPDDRRRITIARLDFPYLEGADAPERVERRLDLMRLEVVDEDWREVVPVWWLHRMRGERP